MFELDDIKFKKSFILNYSDKITNNIYTNIGNFRFKKEDIFNQLKNQKVTNNFYYYRKPYPLYILIFNEENINYLDENKYKEIYSNRNYIYITYYLRLLLINNDFDENKVSILNNSCNNIIVYNSYQATPYFDFYRSRQLYERYNNYIINYECLRLNMSKYDLYNIIMELLYINIITNKIDYYDYELIIISSIYTLLSLKEYFIFSELTLKIIYEKINNTELDENKKLKMERSYKLNIKYINDNYIINIKKI